MSQNSTTIPLARATRLTVLTAALLIGQGCGSKAVSDTHSLVFYQIRFDLPWKVDPTQLLASRPQPPSVGFKLTSDKQVLKLLNGQLKLNGKGYGTVKAGDLVKVTENGEVFVNGEERKPDGQMQG
jgi:hypothetical protein